MVPCQGPVQPLGIRVGYLKLFFVKIDRPPALSLDSFHCLLRAHPEEYRGMIDGSTWEDLMMISTNGIGNPILLEARFGRFKPF